MQYGHCICLKWDESVQRIQSNRQHLIYSRKRLEARLLPQQHQNIRHIAHFLVYNVLAKFQLFCIGRTWGKSSEGNLREKNFKKLDDSEMCTIYNYNLSYNYIRLHKTC